MKSKANIDLLKETRARLSRGGITGADVEAESLIRHFGRMSRVELFSGEKTFSLFARRRIKEAADKRLKGSPLQYLLGETDFFGRRFLVTEDVLIPRPETEILVERALELIKPLRNPKILDVGTGSGCIAVSLTLAMAPCRMTALDISAPALKVARKNSRLHGTDRKIEFIRSDLFSALSKGKKSFFDLIVSNPPYVPKEDFPGLSREVLAEPRLALDGGREGLKIVFSILEQAPLFLKKRGWFLMEIGQGQARQIARKISKEKIFPEFKFVKDYNGIDRVLAAQNG